MSFEQWEAQLEAELNAVAGGSALNLWVPEVGHVFLNGGNVSSIEDVWGSDHVSQGTAANQPAWEATGGAGGRPAVFMQDTARGLLGSGLGIGEANRVGLYVVGQVVAPAAQRILCETLNAANGVVQSIQGNTSSRFQAQLNYTTGLQTLNITAPAHDSSFHIFASRPLASGALFQMDGAGTTPGPTGTAALDDQTQLRIGRYLSNVSGGRFCAALLVNDPTAAKDTIVLARLRQWFRL